MRNPKGQFIKGNQEGKITQFKKGGVGFTGKHSKETKLKISLAKKGKSNGHEGTRVTEETRKKISTNAHRMVGAENPNWLGDGVGYYSLHAWVRRVLGKASKCSNDISHKAFRFHWANISGEYKREVSDWRELCQSCNLTDGVKIPTRFKEGGASLRLSGLH